MLYMWLTLRAPKLDSSAIFEHTRRKINLHMTEAVVIIACDGWLLLLVLLLLDSMKMISKMKKYLVKRDKKFKET
jgi:hypothetical protein